MMYSKLSTLLLTSVTENDKALGEFNSKILAALKKAEDIKDETLEALEFRQEMQTSYGILI